MTYFALRLCSAQPLQLSFRIIGGKMVYDLLAGLLVFFLAYIVVALIVIATAVMRQKGK